MATDPRSSPRPELLSSFIRRERGDLTSPPFAIPDNCLLTVGPPPHPVKFANGSSSNRKSGGGELRGEVMGFKWEIEVEICLGKMSFVFGFTWGAKERDGDRADRGDGVVVNVRFLGEVVFVGNV